MISRPAGASLNDSPSLNRAAPARTALAAEPPTSPFSAVYADRARDRSDPFDEKRVMHAVARRDTVAGAPPTLSLISRLTGKLRTWRRRARERAELARMSQGELHDIGVLSANRWEEIHKPFWRE